MMAAGATASAQASSPAQKVVAGIMRNILKADYEGDRVALKRLHGELAPYVDAQGLSSRVRYWRGFALWRRAINGYNDQADPEELEQDCLAGFEEFQKALKADPGFVDAKAGAYSCLGQAIGLNTRNPERFKQLVEMGTFLRGVLDEDPRNPRLLWVAGIRRWTVPAEQGGGEEVSMAAYKRGLEITWGQKPADADSLEPAWGEPELMMTLAWANLNRATPGLFAAELYARAALCRVPYWHYVRDILLPQILKAKAAAKS